jgi:hypothetical protein
MVSKMSNIDLIINRLGEIYKNAHDIVVRTNHPNALEILRLCNELTEQYMALKKEKQMESKEVEK